MPLPDADPPEKSRLYEELKSKTALPGGSGAITADLIDNLKNATFVDADNEDQLRRLLLISLATGAGSISGPLAGTSKFVSVTVTDTNKATLFQPGVGEVWQLMGIGAVVSGGSGTRTFAAYIFDGATELNWLSVSSSGGNLTFTGEGEYPDAPFFFTEDLYCRVQSTGTFDSVQYNMAVVRVR